MNALGALVADLYGSLRNFVGNVGVASLFFARVLAQVPAALLRPSLVVRQVHNAGSLSLVIIMTSGLVVGMVLGLQGYDLLARFGSEESLGTGAGLALLKELGPVLTALLFAGRAGTALASEIGLMKATDQLAAMEMMAVDSVRYVIAPRFLGGVIAVPLLTAIFIMIGLFGVQFVGVQQLGVDQGTFWSQLRGSVDLGDVGEGLVKGAVFGLACSLIAVNEGMRSEPTAEGVGRATTRAVVNSAVLVLILDYMLTALML
jgi:phospholipid/cholesterol/gamma-HCH transport system permease protein